MKKLLVGFLFLLGLVIILPNEFAQAQSIDNWYIKDYRANFAISKNSSMLVTENIAADCGQAAGKHGIFRVLPLFYQKTANEQVKTPIHLRSITDFNNKPYKYNETINKTDKTISWRIGDPNKTVQGVNNYRINYEVGNVVRQSDKNFDEFYWNLNGNFWELSTNYYKATIVFPAEVSKENTTVNLYSGSTGEKDAGLADYHWEGNDLIVESKKLLNPKEGITVSVTMPKNVFSTYVMTAQDESLYQSGVRLSSGAKKLLDVLSVILPLGILYLCYILWRKYGRDPKINRAVAPEFEIPENLVPIEMGMVDSNGVLRTNYISATVINLAVKGYIQIELIGKTNIFSHEDYKLKKTSKPIEDLGESEKLVYNLLFGGLDEVMLSSLKYKFYENLRTIQNDVNGRLIGEGWIKLTGSYIRIAMIIIAIILAGGGVVLWATVPSFIGTGIILAALIVLVFGIIMPARTQKGAGMEMRIKGFRMYMETAEKYRQQFNEKENIMEKLLPYAIMFAMTKKWIEAMRNIYGEEYFKGYHPVWLQGALLTGGHFDMKHLSESIEAMSHDMAATMASQPSSSGAGGGGFAGGGGGGGGGGGW